MNVTLPRADGPLRFVCHGLVIRIAKRYGWLPGASCANLRHVRNLDQLGFLDIEWKRYRFKEHLAAARSFRPLLTVAQDLENERDLQRTLDQAHELSQYCHRVAIVPKCVRIGPLLEELVPKEFLFAYSVPSRYGGTRIPRKYFRRPVHLLGGRPDVQRTIANELNVISFDCNRFTLDAGFGDFFDGETFRPHPVGGFARCASASMKNINVLWQNYRVSGDRSKRRTNYLGRAELR